MRGFSQTTFFRCARRHRRLEGARPAAAAAARRSAQWNSGWSLVPLVRGKPLLAPPKIIGVVLSAAGTSLFPHLRNDPPSSRRIDRRALRLPPPFVPSTSPSPRAAASPLGTAGKPGKLGLQIRRSLDPAAKSSRNSFPSSPIRCVPRRSPMTGTVDLSSGATVSSNGSNQIIAVR